VDFWETAGDDPGRTALRVSVDGGEHLIDVHFIPLFLAILSIVIVSINQVMTKLFLFFVHFKKNPEHV